MDDQADAMRLARWEAIADQYETRKFAMGQKGRIDTVYKPAPPELLYLDDDAWSEAVKERRTLAFTAHRQATGPGVIDAGGRTGRDFAPERQQEKISLFKSLADHIQKRLEVGPVVVASYSEGARERLDGLIEDEGLPGAVPVQLVAGPGCHRRSHSHELPALEHQP